MATDIIARGMAAGSVKPGSDGKIPAEYLPSYVDDIIDLVAISDTAPATCAEGDKYYNSTDKLIYTATGTNTWGTTGETPETGRIYINTAEDPSGSYRWDGLNLVLIGASGGQTIQYTEMPTAEAAIEGEIIQYIGDTDSTYTNGYFYQCVEDNGSYLWENIDVQPNTIGKDIYLFVTGEPSATSLATGQAILDYYNTKGYMPVVYFQPSSNAKSSYCECVFAGKPYNNYSLRFQVYQFDDMSNQYFGTPVLNYWGIIYMHCDSEFTTVNTVSLPTALGNTNYHRSFRPLAGYQRGINNVPSSSQAYANEDMALTITNTKAYTPAIGSYNPATALYADNTAIDVANQKTALLNYDGGEHNKIYFNAANTLGVALPENAVESPYHGPDYTLEYTYTTAQSITPATRFTAHIVKILKTSYIDDQSISIVASIIRNDTVLATVSPIVHPSTERVDGTANDTTLSFDIPFDFALDESLSIQNGDIFRLVIKSSRTYNVTSSGAIYSSSINPTYVEQYSGGMSANYLYDTINGVTYTQHEINQMGGGGSSSILLKTVSDTAPTTGLASGDKYYAPTANKIYTYDGTNWDAGVTPETNSQYISLDSLGSYFYNGSIMAANSMFTYYWDGTAVSSGDSRIPIFQKIEYLAANNLPFDLTIKKSLSMFGTGWAQTFKLTTYKVQSNTAHLKCIDQSSKDSGLDMHFIFLSATINSDGIASSTITGFPVFKPLGYNNGQDFGNNYFLNTNNTTVYAPTQDYHPATAKFVTDTIAAKTILLNYDSGNYDTIYLDAANTLGTATPSVDVESGNHGPAYTMEYTYTSAQSITPATKYIFHLTKILKGSKISGQDISVSAYIVRNNTVVLTKENVKIGTIPETTGTADVTTVTVEGRFGFELENTFAIQNGDIFRLVVASSYTGDYYLGGAIYSSSTTPTYVSQYSGGVNAEYVYDTINGTTYSQHDINAMSGGSVPMYLITGTTQADVDKINECCDLFTQNKPFAAYYKSTAGFGTKYVPIIFFTMGTNDIFMNFIGWAGYSGNGQTLVWGQIQGTGTPGEFSAITIYDDPSNYKELIGENYFQNLTNYSQYKVQTLENNNGTLNWIDGSINPVVTSDSTTAAYTIASLTGNQTYKLGELTDLTITAVTTFDRESIIYFSSGSTPTDISIPDSLTNLGDVPTLTTASNVSTGTCEASKSYIIAILNNIAVWKAY